MSGMVTFKNAGRAGNYLFECAAALTYSWKRGIEFSAPTTARPGHPVFFQHLVNPRYNPALPIVDIKEHGYIYQELEFKEEWREANIILDGYWQSPLYFNDYREKIIDAFALPWIPTPGKVSVHVRRGDYLTIRNPKTGQLKHPPVTVDWILNAMARFPRYEFLFFSDDLSWCEHMFGRESDCSFSTGKTELEDLAAMSSCDHHINSASTFSWWGSYLGRNPLKRCIVPAHWLSPGWDGPLLEDVIPSDLLNWEKMP